jgi:sugar (pentulose or hexulose) kinase
MLPQASVGAPFGDAVLVGMGLGLYPDVSRALREMVRLQTHYEPDWENHERYSQIYPIFRSIYEQLRGVFDKAAVILNH